jgi:hypothetical protein
MWGPWAKANLADLARYAIPGSTRLLRLEENAHDLSERPDGRRALVQAIYDALVRRRVRYSLEPHDPSPHTQLIRTPQEILEAPGQGTCLDLALLFCGLCLGYELLPVLVVVGGHALVAVSLAKGRREAGAYSRSERELFTKGVLTGNEGLEELRSLVERGDYVAVESTGFSHSETLPGSSPEGAGRVGGYLPFEKATRAGLEQLGSTSRPFQFALDVAVLHDLGVTPYGILPEPVELKH